ncbi:exonuclease SbcCD subunit D [Listeria sp. SHR_NRA_18]|uniref:exonuclease SbcCD subunit D n=1 Tax=Listeria sp. SHR_NRA_18 TaxID=2269046 RepID=UPI00051DD02F|nr:exonuclease SbcCD subunit D [Listeria sp. SHR_NRA_18]KGL45144.1 DNA repair exonuclease [Listeriaceae bacterium FSL A5-0209]RQW68217.1 exonuclease SbcCD subunit D [Listeria sp. SHR_NRA_18]
MKFLHTADWHLGKIVNGVSMLAEQRYILEQIARIAEEEQVDGIVIAGDLYDRSVPPADAVTLLNNVLMELNVTLGKPVFAISGNHDSAERVNFGSAWYEKSGLHIQGTLGKELAPIEWNGAQVWLVPYHEPAQVRAAFEEKTVRSFEDAMQAVTAKIRAVWDTDKAQILVGHAFVAGGLPSDSERQLAIGNVDRVSTNCFEGFDYVALGHLHHSHAIHHPSIFYAGSPLKYSFSEAKDKKSVRIVTMDGKALVEVRERYLEPLHDLRIIEGYLADLVSSVAPGNEDFLQINLLDEGALIDPIGQLRAFYPNVLHLERVQEKLTDSQFERFEDVIKKDDLELFAQFFEHVSGKEMSDRQVEIMRETMDSVKGGADQ